MSDNGKKLTFSERIVELEREKQKIKSYHDELRKMSAHAARQQDAKVSISIISDIFDKLIFSSEQKDKQIAHMIYMLERITEEQLRQGCYTMNDNAKRGYAENGIPFCLKKVVDYKEPSGKIIFKYVKTPSPQWQSWMRNSYRAELERLCAKVRGLHRRRAIPAQVTDEMVRVYRKAGDAFQEAVEQLQQGG